MFSNAAHSALIQLRAHMSTNAVREVLERKAKQLEDAIAADTLPQRMQLADIRQKIHAIWLDEERERLAAERERTRRYVWIVVRTTEFPRSEFKLVELISGYDTETEAWAAVPGNRPPGAVYRVEKVEIVAKKDIEYASD